MSGGWLGDESRDFSYAEAQRDFGRNPWLFEDGIGLEAGIKHDDYCNFVRINVCRLSTLKSYEIPISAVVCLCYTS